MSTAFKTYAVYQVVAATGLTRVFALVFATPSLICTLMFGAAYVKLRTG